MPLPSPQVALDASRGKTASNSNVATYFLFTEFPPSDLSKKFAGKISKQLAQAIICESRLGQRRYQIQKNMLKNLTLIFYQPGKMLHSSDCQLLQHQ